MPYIFLNWLSFYELGRVAALPKVVPPEWNIAQLMEGSRNIAGDKDHFTWKLGSFHIVRGALTLWLGLSKSNSLSLS